MPRKAAKSVVKAEETALAEVRGSIIKIRIGKRTYDAVRDPSCPVCIHPGRPKIEEQLLFNEPFPAIAEMVSGVEYERIDGVRVDWPVLTPQQIASHFRRKHVPVNATMLHHLTEERRAEMAEGYEKMTSRVVDEIVIAKQIVARGQERMTRGEIEPSVRETLAAVKIVAAVEQAAKQNETQDRTWFYEQATQVFFETARTIMNDQQWREFSRQLNTNPFLRQITERAQNPDGVQDAEIVEEHAS